MAPEDAALCDLLRWLKVSGYAFVTPTPMTHAHYLKRAGARDATGPRDIFGWNLPFRSGALVPEVFSLLRQADALEQRGELFVSRYRVATCSGLYVLHSAFPTVAHDSVFFGPDSYRFAAFVQRELSTRLDTCAILDVGAGTGIGALIAAALVPDAKLTLTDVNPVALRLARINAAAANTSAKFVEAPDLDGVEGAHDVVLANPPYMSDPMGRQYRDGGDSHGAALSLCWADAVAARLRSGGALLLYTGTAIVSGRDSLREALTDVAERRGCLLRYTEIDPDVWGEELKQPDYGDVERIAVVGAVLDKQ